MYRFLDKRFYHKPDWEFELKDFAFEHVGLSRTYRDAGKIKEKLQRGIEELEQVGFLEPLPRRAAVRQAGAALADPDGPEAERGRSRSRPRGRRGGRSSASWSPGA